MNKIIVSRHPAAIRFIARHLCGFVAQQEPNVIIPGETEEIPVIAEATPEQVFGKQVYGNLPMHLAVFAAAVHVVEFQGSAPRGAEYTLEQMDAAGARIRTYKVSGGPIVEYGVPQCGNMPNVGDSLPWANDRIVVEAIPPSDSDGGYVTAVDPEWVHLWKKKN